MVYNRRFEMSRYGVGHFIYTLQGRPLMTRHTFYDCVRKSVNDIRSDTRYSVINVQFVFRTIRNHIEYLSLPCSVDIASGIANFEEGNFNMYENSDRAYWLTEQSALSFESFEIIVMPTSGSGGTHSSRYYKTKNVGRHGDCLISCVRYHTQGYKYQESSVRQMLHLPEGALDLSHVPALERIYKVEVAVYADRRDLLFFGKNTLKNDPILLYGNASCPNRILYANDHFSIITGDKEILPRAETKKPKKEKTHKYYYFFDFETVFDREFGRALPYAWSVVKCNSAGDVLDKETHVGKPSTDVGYAFDNYLRNNEPGHLIGYNNSRFDNFILLNSSKNVGHCFFAGNSILKMFIHGYSCYDLCRLLCTSMKNAAQSFECNVNKLEFDHHRVQTMYENDTWVDPNVTDYVERDVDTLRELFFKCRSAFQNDIETYPTIGSMTYGYFKKEMAKKRYELPILPYEDDAFIRQAVIGGRAEIYQQKHIQDIITVLDIVSLYPYVMMNRRYPIGKGLHTHTYQHGKIGVYRVKILSQPTLNIIPLRQLDGSLDWKYRGIIECTLSSVDIECLRQNSATLEISSGIYWESDVDDMFEHFIPIMEQKMHQDELKDNKQDYNAALRETLKLFLNALSGKLIQRIFTNERVLITSKHVKQQFESSHNNILYHYNDSYIVGEGEKQQCKPTMPTICGILIYAYARQHMYDNVLKHAKTRICTDTDSLYYLQSEHEQGVIDPSLFGNRFGQLKHEADMKEGIFVAPKCYYTRNDSVVKMRFKGIGTEDRLISHEEAGSDMNFEQSRQLYLSKKECLSMNVYKRLLSGEMLYFLCSRIEKSTSMLSLTGNYIVKSSESVF